MDFKPNRSTWTHISLTAAVVSFSAVVGSVWIGLPPMELLGALFVLGGLAGAWAGRQSWLSGVIVGLPLAWTQLTRSSLDQYHTLGGALIAPDYWRIVPWVSVLASGVAIMGALVGSWVRNSWRRAP